MAKILFWPDIYLEQGHWLPCVSMAQALNATGQHTAKFIGIADCESVVNSHTRTGQASDTDMLSFVRIFDDIYPLGYTRGHQHKSINERWKPDHLLPIMNGEIDKFVACFGAEENELPDLIVGGYFAALELLMMHYRTGCKIMVSTTYLRHPQDDPGIFVTQKLLGLSDAVAEKVMQELVAIKTNDVNAATPSIATFVDPLMRARELLPCPLEFEFDNYKHNMGVIGEDAGPDSARRPVFFTEPCVTRTVRSNIPDDIKWDEIGNKKIIFATAGSQVQDYEQKARYMFQKLVALMKSPGMSEYHLVLGVGPKFMKESWIKDELPSNASAASWVDQRKAILKSSVVFIHGGLATIKEAICEDVPVVILPMGKDQMDNALRLRRKNLAVVSYAEALTIDELRELLVKAQTDPKTQVRRRAMSNLFSAMESGVNAVGNRFQYATGKRASLQVIEQALADVWSTP